MSDKLYSPIIYDPISKIYYKQELNTHVGIVLNAQQQFVNKLIKQRDQYKAENEKLRERNKKLEKRNNQKVRRYLRGGLKQMRIEDLENKYNGMIAERNNLIDDLSRYKAKVSKLERENECYDIVSAESKEEAEEMATGGKSRLFDVKEIVLMSILPIWLFAGFIIFIFKFLL